MKSKVILIVALFCIWGCGSALQSKPTEVSALPQGKGVIVGSVFLKQKDESAMFPLATSEKTWYAVVRPDDDSFLSKMFPPEGRHLTIEPDGKEVPFVSVLAPGKYKIDELGTFGSAPNFKLSLSVKFLVEENKKTYIGRLAITLPSHVNMFENISDQFIKGLFYTGNYKSVAVAIEDAQDDTVNALSGDYGISLAEGLQKGLMSDNAK